MWKASIYVKYCDCISESQNKIARARAHCRDLFFLCLSTNSTLITLQHKNHRHAAIKSLSRDRKQKMTKDFNASTESERAREKQGKSQYLLFIKPAGLFCDIYCLRRANT